MDAHKEPTYQVFHTIELSEQNLPTQENPGLEKARRDIQVLKKMDKKCKDVCELEPTEVGNWENYEDIDFVERLLNASAEDFDALEEILQFVQEQQLINELLDNYSTQETVTPLQVRNLEELLILDRDQRASISCKYLDELLQEKHEDVEDKFRRMNRLIPVHISRIYTTHDENNEETRPYLYYIERSICEQINERFIEVSYYSGELDPKWRRARERVQRNKDQQDT